MGRKTTADIDTAILTIMREHGIVGLSASRVQDGEVTWAQGYGWADIETGKKMTPDTVQNIGSISKTFTCTAVLQLWEQGLFKLDEAVNSYLPFEIKHPAYKTPITFLHLLQHTSGIADGPAYESSYVCGDPAITLEDWIKGYLLPGGRFYSAEENYHPWEAGTNLAYSNVGFGLLGYLLESIAGVPFNQYCKTHLFEPLKMVKTGWMLSEIDRDEHATLYAAPEDAARFKPLLAAASEPAGDTTPVPLCPYSFPNYPDGLVRTSVRELAQYAASFMAPTGGKPLLNAGTIARCLTPQTEEREMHGMTARIGLAWFNMTTAQRTVWLHSGGDPGVSTMLQLSPETRDAIVYLSNSNHNMRSTQALCDLLWDI